MSRFSTRSLVILAAIQLFCIYAIAQDNDWRPVTPEELQMKTPKVEPDADAEVLFWEVRVSDEYVPRSGFKTVLRHYIRTKIFTEKGRDDNNRIDLDYGKAGDLGVDLSVKDIAARTIDPGGSIAEVKPSDIFERETVKGKGIKFLSKSFVLPNVKVGSIVEYRWTEIRGNSLSYFVRLKLAREIPVRYVKYYIKPVAAPYFNLGMRVHSINTSSHFTPDAGGYYSTSMEDIPSFKEEAFMPSEYEVQPWILVYYEGDDSKASAEEYWRHIGRDTYDYHKSLLEPNNEIKQAAVKVIGDATDTETRLRRIYEYCRDHVMNVDDDATGMTPEQLKNVKPNKKPSDAISRGTGTWHDKDMLFGAMLASIGIDVRVANVASRTEPAFDRSLGNAFFIRAEIIAAKIGDSWRFFAPSGRYIPYGSLPSTVEGEPALISDKEKPFFVNTPRSSPEVSVRKHTADLHLNEDGTIEGDVRIEFTGQLGAALKEQNDDRTTAEREKILTDSIKSQTIGTAEITAISIENVTDGNKPFTYAFHIKLPAYADRTGKRLFVQPNVFERSTGPKFVKSTRKYDISFDYAWEELDDITIKLPAGYKSESTDPMQKVTDDDGNLSCESKLDLSADGSTLHYNRTFVLGSKSTLTYSKYAYARIKGYFDSIHRMDTQGILLVKNDK